MKEKNDFFDSKNCGMITVRVALVEEYDSSLVVTALISVHLTTLNGIVYLARAILLFFMPKMLKLG